MEDLNSKRLKRLASRVGDLDYKYNSEVTSATYGDDDTSYQLTYSAVESLNEPINVTLDIVDGKLNVDNTTIV